MDFKDTLLMPKTDFPMRGNLGVNEINIQEYWKKIDLYKKVLEQNKDNEPFILHDGPPYANGDIHVGHAFQKTLKDFVLRYQTMKGRYVPYIPGWDTHGLPIETAVTKKGINRKEISRSEFRKHCREFALQQVERQKAQFMRIGILGDWDNPYLTLDKSFVSDQVKIFSQMVARGLIYKGLKPIYWSPSSESALAEAEIEYHDKQSKSIYFTFKLTDKKKFKDTSLIIWTTTPWTLPANLAVSVHPTMNYNHILVDGKKYIVAEALLGSLKDKLSFNSVEVLDTFKGQTLENLTYKHPIFDRTSPIILGEHVTDTDGTGLVHTAPGHGEDDYIVGKKYNLDILCPVNETGMMTNEAGKYEGLFYEKANDAIIEDLKETNSLLRVDTITHSYPHDWRTKKPVIFRATPQWFASVKMIREELLKEVEKTTWLPKWGEVRIGNMLKDREDWVISRQRAWGVPIPIFYAENETPILDSKVIDHVADLFLEHGSDIWYEWDAKDLLPKGYKNVDSPNNQFKKEVDIMDVWFDSGTSYSVLKRRNLPFPADLYLEGADQHRGWFNSSLITSTAAFNQAPYKAVVTHGFVFDGQGRKMSKSLGNVVDPLVVMKQKGADLLRLWVANVDYQSDVRISNEMMDQVAEMYRKIRNTLRFMVGNLNDFDPKKDYVGYSMRGQINRAITIDFRYLINDILNAYENYEFDKVSRLVVPFITNEISAFYLDYTKDILYIEKANNFERRAIQSTIYDMTMGLLKVLTPIIPHTTSEVYSYLPFEKLEDIYLEKMPTKNEFKDENLMNNYRAFRDLRENILKQLELARDQKIIGKSLQAEVDLTITKALHETLEQLDALKNLHQLLIVSKVNITIGENVDILVKKANGHVCARCWNIVSNVNSDELCSRCEKALEE
ncbi:Isoleucyl-tRNA synthetase [Alteracholeplasma palmae J233]|uniref:Isoleucine--tRNA ligase n=1 Tax=Alteracholeplasma palmae (strain ATCC 49389 / J233) TaxID=1318466 RepID=U4KRU4_ALTPJ|nr:isoleucine--tRNA ligase [Alteracholeplasma palmae]CCV64446.1 Isoleucyl-tRNA synthetase [Alteracholeplasma palmae J233]